MSPVKERLKASVPFVIVALLIAWLGHQSVHNAMTLEKLGQSVEQHNARVSGVVSLQKQWQEVARELPQSSPTKLLPRFGQTLSRTSEFMEKALIPMSQNGLTTSASESWTDLLRETEEFVRSETAGIDRDYLEVVCQKFLYDLDELEKMVQAAQETSVANLLAYKPPSYVETLLVTVLTLLLVLLMENIFAGQIRHNLVSLRDTLLHLNQNRLDLDTKLVLKMRNWTSTMYPLPKIAYLLNCFLEKHGEVMRKIKVSADNCENATSLIRNCHNDIYEGTRVQANSSDETSSSTFQMAATLNEIATNVQNLSRSAEESSSSIQEMDSSIHQISGSSEGLFTLVEDSSSSITELVASIGQIRENLSSLSGSVENTTSSVSEITASINEVGQMAKESAALSQKSTDETSELGVKAVQKTIEGMQRIQTSVEEADSVIKNLNQRSEEIGEILTVIDEVAEQTNLLALNASIIAAQAGEHGKGFGVVADEIKALAERTTSSIGQIERAISSVQEETHTVSRSIHLSVQQVQDGVSLSEDTKRVLQKLLAQSKKSSEMSCKIENAADEQVKSIHHVNSEIQNINQMVHQIAAAIKEQDKGGGMIGEMVEKLKNFAHELKRSMTEETKGSRAIATEIENFFDNIQEINRAIQEHRRGSEQIANSIERIRLITEENINLTDDLSTAITSLSVHNDELQKEIETFQFTADQDQICLGVVPLESEIKMQLKFTPLARYLEQKLKKKVEIRVARDLDAAVKDLGTGKTDIAYLTPSTYIEARKQFGSKVILKAVRNHSPFYRSVIAVKEGAPISSLSDIKGKKVGFGDKKSTSSFHVPKAMLARENIQLSDLREYVFAGNHTSVAWAIVNGDVDAGCLLEPVAKKFVAKGLKILKFSEEIPEFNFCVNPKMDADLQGEITRALLALDEEQPEHRSIIKTIEYDYNGFMLASENDYQGIEAIMQVSEQEVA